MTPLVRTCINCGVSFETTLRVRANTCSPECHRKQRHLANERSRKRAAEVGCPDEKHGTATGYSRYGCRCPDCKAWIREYWAKKRAKEREAGSE